MKHLKWVFSAFTVMAVVAMVFAFTPAKHTAVKKAILNQHWQFNGTTVAEESDPSKYSLVTGSDPGCSGSGLTCVIDAPADPLNTDQPDLSQMTVISQRDN